MMALWKHPQGQRVEMSPKLSASARICAIVLECWTMEETKDQRAATHPLQGGPAVPACYLLQSPLLLSDKSASCE